MRIAFYAPMKPPTHPVPSGDRRMARSFMALLGGLGHEVELASRFRSYDGTGDPLRQAQLRQLGGQLVARLLRRWRDGSTPELWFTYHLYHKAPDWLGPGVCDALRIPYVVAEASLGAKRASGPWSAGYVASGAAIARADLVLAMTTNDLPGLQAAVAPSRLTLFPPFLDAEPFASEPHPASGPVPTLLAVAMMRADAKRASYQLLAAALKRLTDLPWQIVLVGDGEARSEVEAMFAPLGERVVWRGAVPLEALPAIYAAADLLVWPACNEAYGMALLEAQAAGLPVVAGREGGVPDIVADGTTGLLTEPRSDLAFAAGVRALLSDPERRQRMGRAARERVLARHDLPHARAQLAAALAGLRDSGMRICLIRHGTTAWNAAGRIQGRRDVPLSDAGRVQVRGWRLPDGFAQAACMASPLRRALETAALLGINRPAIDSRLAEMDWGEFEGRTFTELRAELGPAMQELEDSGLDFRPPGGESPREVAGRLGACLRSLTGTERDVILVAHKGILRASLVLSHGWEMLGKPPVRYEPDLALIHRLAPTGALTFEAAVPLVPQS